MKRFTSIQLGGSVLRCTSILILSLFLLPIYSNAQCNLACNNVVQISIGSDCSAEITPDALLEGAVPAGAFTILFDNGQADTVAAGSDVFSDIDWSSLLGETGYTIKSMGCSNSCWGRAIIEQNIFPDFDGDVDCTYVPAEAGKVEAKFNAGNVATGVEVEITLPRCPGINPTISLGSPINFACASAPSGWCTLNCTNTITSIAVNANNTLTWKVRVTVADQTLAAEYFANIGPEFICDVNYSQQECIPCETWCGGSPPEFISIDSLRRSYRKQAGDCVNNITNLREVVKSHGDVCAGIVTVVETYGDFTQHGVTESRLLLSQAYRQNAIPLFDPLTDELKTGPAGQDVFVFPGKKIVSCGESTDPVDIESVPLFHNFWKTVVTHPDTCRLVHYLAHVDTVRESIEIVPGIWSIQDVIKKELRDSMRCAPDSSQVINTNPFESLYPSKFCNLVSSYSDVTTPLCGNGKKILRDWTVVDWCKAKLVIRTQVIEERDTKAPESPGVHTTHTVGTEPWTCEVNFDLDYPAFTDNCDEDLDIDFDILNDQGVWVPVEALKPGRYLIAFTAIDDCNNRSKSHTDTLIVVDDVPPIPVCKDKLVVSITPQDGGGVAKVLAEDFDKGSHDGGCGPITKIQVIRVEDFIESVDHAFGGMTFAGLPETCDPHTGLITVVDKDKFGDALPPQTNVLSRWHDYVKFCCTDIGPDNMVLMRVWDGAGNYNSCMVNVEVQDKTLFSCPDDVTIMCTEYSPDVVFGNAETNLVCSNGNASYVDDADLDGCGAGRVIRIWSSTNGSGIETSCPQLITVEKESVFDPASIRWPIHYIGGEPGSGVRLEPKDGECVELPGPVIEYAPVLNCMDDLPECGPEYNDSEACGLVGVSVKSDTIYQVDNTCLKVIRHWTVIDWCTWGPNGDATGEVGDDENDTDADQFQLVEDWCLESGCIKDQEASTYFRYLPKEDGGYYDEDGYYTFDQVILLYDDTKPEFMSMEVDTMQPGTENSCLGNIALVNNARDEGFCGRELLQWYVTLLDSTGTQYGNVQTGLGNAFGFTVSDIPLGKYTIVWTVKDGCDNQAVQETDVTLLDTSEPTPICIQNISTAVMNTNGEVEIWASDFDPERKSFDPCGDDILYSFAKDEYVPNLTITCADVIGQSEEMFVYVQDPTGNSSACRVNLRVDHGGICDGFNCETVGGEFLTVETDLTELTICINGTNTGFRAKVWENVGSNSSYLVTDEDGNILEIPTGPVFDFGGAGTGVCLLWHVSSEGTLRGVDVGSNAADILGCFSLSNPIIVNKVDSGEECDGPCETEGGKFVTDVTDLEEVTVCVNGENTGFKAKVWENLGDPSQLITDADGNILSIPTTAPDYDFAGQSPGVCYLWHVSSNGTLSGVEVGNNVSDIGGCYSLSNPIIVTKVDSGEACESQDGSAAIISGNIATAYGESIGEARVMLDNSFIPEYPVSQMTSGLTGNYAFGSNPMYSEYNISVEKNGDHMNGVSTLDLVYMQHHILGLKPLDSPYKVIAADINDDQRITASDLVILRKLILGIVAELPDNSSWRFVDKGQEFSNINTPWPFQENISISDLSSDMAEQDFVGVKIGDVNGSAQPSNLASTEVRSNSKINFSIEDQTYEVGDLIEVNISSEGLNKLAGFQTTVAHQGLEFIGVKSTVLDINEDNTANHGTVTAISWNTAQAVDVSGEMLTMVFVATDNSSLSQSFQINDRIVPSEVYNGANIETNSIALNFTEGTIGEASFELLQNKPNPFSENTEIGFRLPKSDVVSLKLYDVAGRLIHKQTGTYNAGLNTITISSDIIESGGLIYYSLESGDYSATRKMILLK